MSREGGFIMTMPFARIVVLSKSPEPEAGRIGQRESQDWYQTCVAATQLLAELEREYQEVEILVPTAVRLKGCRPEGEIYSDALRELGVSARKFKIVPIGFDTISQVEYGLYLAEENHWDVIFVSTALHNPRVRWLCCGSPCRQKIFHVSAGGVPRP